MKKLYVTCYRHMAIDDFGRLVAAPMTPPLAEIVLDITSESVTSDPFPDYTSFICVKATSDCALGFNEDADLNYHFVDAGERLFYGAKKNDTIFVISTEAF